MNAPQPGQFYCHRNSGRHYLVIALATDVTTEELLVVYRSIEESEGTFPHWARPVLDFAARFEVVP